MRTALIAISLCLALGAAACTSEEERQKAQLRAQIEEGLVEYEAVLERYNAAGWEEQLARRTGSE